MPPKQQTLAGFFGGAAGVKRTVEEEKPVEADENALSVQNSKSSSEVKRTEAATEDDIIAQGDTKRMKTTALASANDAKTERASADAVKSPLRDVTTKAEPLAADSTKPAYDGNDDEEIVVSTRRRSKASSRALEDDYEDEDEIDSDEEDSEIEDDIEDVEVGAPKTGKMPKTKKAKKAKKEEAATAGVGDKSVEAADRYLSYDPKSVVTWKEGSPTPYLYLANIFESIAETTKRLEIAELLTNAFRTILASNPSDLLPAVYLASNTIHPQHVGIDLGIGDATLIKCLAEATGRKDDAIKSDYKEAGDLGSVAMVSRSTQRMMFPPPPLTVAGVLNEFRAIATTEGEKSVDRKKSKIKKLLVSARECEAGYVVRSLQGKLRIGLAQQTVTQSLAHAIVLNSDIGKKIKGAELADELGNAVEILKHVFSECPTFDEIVPALLEVGFAGLQERCKFMPGVPVKPMLAKPTTGVLEVLKRFEDIAFTCEYKYDGERAQIHLLEDGTVKIFSRNQEDNTAKFPDLITGMKRYVKPGVKSVVIDCEAVAYDREKDQILPFQILSTRGKKNIVEDQIKVKVALYAFDCLYLNGKPLLLEPMSKRREALYEAFQSVPGEFFFVTEKTSRDVDELQGFLEDAIQANTEGLIVKTLDATYEPSKRSLNWLKLKKDYMEGCGDSLDLVPIGAWVGRGKRTGVYGAYLLACYDEDGEEYQSICKIGTGFSEVVLEELANSMNPHVIDGPRSYYRVGEGMKPDVWFDPKQVWEVKAADLSISPVHQAAAGLVDPTKGIALRFPRFLRRRDDKSPEMATNAEQVAEFYNAQACKQTFDGEDA
jgi:DNA ligase 1